LNGAMMITVDRCRT